MSFNLKIESAKDYDKIPKSRKRRSELLGIADFAIAEGGFIVLDPKANFTKVKISRILNKKMSIGAVKNKLRARGINVTGLTLAFGDGSVGTGQKSNATETRHQENATKVFCEFLVEKNREPSFEDMKREYPKVDDDWIDSFRATAIHLKKWLGSNKGYEYSRDTGIMPFLEEYAKKYGGVKVKDNWNPMDIVIVRKSKKKKIMDDIKTIENIKDPEMGLDALNDKMRFWGKSKDLVGVSLKKVNPKRKIKTEWSDPAVERKQNPIEPTIMRNSLRLNMDLKDNGEFKTGNMNWKLNVAGKVVECTFRSFVGGIREKSGIEMKEAGASAQLGKVSLPKAVDRFLNPRSLQRLDTKAMPKQGEWKEDDIKFWVNKYKKLKNIRFMGETIDWGTVVKNDSDFEVQLRKAITLEKDIDRTASQLSCKIQSMHMLEIMDKLQKKKELMEYMRVLYYGAKKQFSDAGVFLKISD